MGVKVATIHQPAVRAVAVMPEKRTRSPRPVRWPQARGTSRRWWSTDCAGPVFTSVDRPSSPPATLRPGEIYILWFRTILPETLGSRLLVECARNCLPFQRRPVIHHLRSRPGRVGSRMARCKYQTATNRVPGTSAVAFQLLNVSITIY